MINRILITGCTQGLGRALALRFAQAGLYVYAVGRNQELLEELAKNSPLIHPIKADIATESGRQAIVEQIDQKPISIIHNAAVAKPCPFNSLSEPLLREHVETNFIAPILITQQFLTLLKGQRVLHISSGAASVSLPSLMQYCTTKAAMEHAANCLNAELKQQGIYFANLRPGMMSTSMQANLRNTDSTLLPNQAYYIQVNEKHKLLDPEVTAEFASWVMLKTDNTEFSQTLWSVYDEAYQAKWLPQGWSKPTLP
ncbi:MAG: dehydrogenase with different specificity [Gammaproteobacteria bacterium]|jgi:NAD(P)-dependent dehydrogenase (short-subunit alcohol dehydrogenase family)|nr:dehydrogenase with different specificity [Gammaproteobacteria bacterium]